MDDYLVHMARTALRCPVIIDEKEKTHDPKRYYAALRPALTRIEVYGTDSK